MVTSQPLQWTVSRRSEKYRTFLTRKSVSASKTENSISLQNNRKHQLMKRDPAWMFSGGFVPVGALLRCTRVELYKGSLWVTFSAFWTLGLQRVWNGDLLVTSPHFLTLRPEISRIFWTGRISLLGMTHSLWHHCQLLTVTNHRETQKFYRNLGYKLPPGKKNIVSFTIRENT